MNTQAIEKNWSELKGKIKTQWSKINDDQIESVRKDFNQLSARIQTAYGVAKEDAEKQYADFKKTIEPLISDEAPAAVAQSPEKIDTASTK